MARRKGETKDLDIQIGDVYYADSSYGCVRPRFYRVTKITPKTVAFEGIGEMYVHYRRDELKYMGNSPEYYVIPFSDDDPGMVDRLLTKNDPAGGWMASLSTGNRSPPRWFHMTDEDGRFRISSYRRESFRSQVGIFQDGRPYLSEPGKYGGLLYKYESGKAIYGCCD